MINFLSFFLNFSLRGVILGLCFFLNFFPFQEIYAAEEPTAKRLKIILPLPHIKSSDNLPTLRDFALRQVINNCLEHMPKKKTRAEQQIETADEKRARDQYTEYVNFLSYALSNFMGTREEIKTFIRNNVNHKKIKDPFGQRQDVKRDLSNQLKIDYYKELSITQDCIKHLQNISADVNSADEMSKWIYENIVQTNALKKTVYANGEVKVQHTLQGQKLKRFINAVNEKLKVSHLNGLSEESINTIIEACIEAYKKSIQTTPPQSITHNTNDGRKNKNVRKKLIINDTTK